MERVSNRFPRFYKYWQRDSLIYTLLMAVSKQMDEVEKAILRLMKGHWVDTAKEDELDKLGALVAADRMPEEKDKHFRTRLKRAVNEYKGGGTVVAISEVVKALTGAKGERDVEIIENPRVGASAEFKVIAGNTWTLSSDSITDEKPSLTLAVEEKGHVSNPRITNVDTGEFVAFKGRLKSGEQLVIKDEKAYIGETDVTENVTSAKLPLLHRKSSTWRYSEAILERIAVFDTAKFDEHTFAVQVPTVTVHFDWVRSQPATFLVKINPKALRESGVAQPYVERVVNSMKASGINAIIEVSGK